MVLFLAGCGFAWLTWQFNHRLTRLEGKRLALEKKVSELRGDVMMLQRRVKRHEELLDAIAALK